MPTTSLTFEYSSIGSSFRESPAPNTGLGSGFTLGVGSFAQGLGAMCLGASCYVMRADSLPPRKNVFSRMADNALELYEEYKKPVLGLLK